MLKTPPQDMYIFTMREIADLGINLGGPILIADLDLAVQPTPGANSPGDSSQVVPPANDTPPVQPGTGGTAYVQLALQSTEAEANRSLEYARERWAGLLAGAAPEIERLTVNGSTQYRIRVPARSMENANALCAAIKSAGGGCFVTSG
jgi:hypothetical protein